MISEHPGLLLAIFLWCAWVLGLYVVLSAVRLMALRGRQGLDVIETRVAANLSNQFEAPLLLLAAIILLLMERAVGTVVTAAVWVFLFGRVVHSIVHIGQPRIVPRGLVFTINFLAILVVWGVLFKTMYVAGP